MDFLLLFSFRLSDLYMSGRAPLYVSLVNLFALALSLCKSIVYKKNMYVSNQGNQARKRKCATIWCNSPYSMNVKTNIGKTFLKLLQTFSANPPYVHHI